MDSKIIVILLTIFFCSCQNEEYNEVKYLRYSEIEKLITDENFDYEKNQFKYDFTKFLLIDDKHEEFLLSLDKSLIDYDFYINEGSFNYGNIKYNTIKCDNFKVNKVQDIFNNLSFWNMFLDCLHEETIDRELDFELGQPVYIKGDRIAIVDIYWSDGMDTYKLYIKDNAVYYNWINGVIE